MQTNTKGKVENAAGERAERRDNRMERGLALSYIALCVGIGVLVLVLTLLQ